MIHAFALQPELVATWARRSEYRFIHDKFGVGATRALLELPSFTEWKRLVYDTAKTLGLSEQDEVRLAELFRVFAEHKCRRADAVYDGVLSWLENGEREYDRRPFAGILATENPRGHRAVLLSDDLLQTETRWACPPGHTTDRTAEGLAVLLTGMLVNCRILHLVDPYFGPENARHRKVLEALTGVLAANGVKPELIRIHCGVKPPLSFFEESAAEMAARIPSGITIEFRRWAQRSGGDRFHNRYILTDLGGVSLGLGLEAGKPGESDELLLLPAPQYVRRWAQYDGNDGSFHLVDTPKAVQGHKAPAAPRESKGKRRG